jgi:NAD(P)-dependent dehydrogenase (short-subunit alcohol dehydrogenase family)/acyl dehydratase
MAPLSLTTEHVRRFAEASGDRNPLHVDEQFARATPYGRCIVHGALVTIAALGSAHPASLRHAQRLDIQFKQPVFPDAAYVVSCVQADEDKTRLEVAKGGRVAATIAVTTDRSAPPLSDARQQVLDARTQPSPRAYSLAELSGNGLSISEPYGCRLDLLSELATEVGDGSVPISLLAWLAAASYTVGMLVPGRDAVFAGAQIGRSPAAASGTVTASVLAADDRTGLVVVQAEVAQDDASARMTLQTFLRPPAPTPDRTTVGRCLPDSTKLAGRNALVVGGSRGLGAALCGVLATQGATVWASFARSTERAAELSREFGPERVRPLQFDAADPEEARRALESLRAEAGTIDSLVLCAAPPLVDTSLHPETIEETLRLVHASLAMTLVPLAAALDLLAPEGRIVITSSSALDDPPEPWPHYVIAKAALEGAAAYCARHVRARVLVVRPPKMWTDSTNTPLGRIGAVATEQVAAAVARWVADEDAQQGMSLLTAEQLVERA